MIVSLILMGLMNVYTQIEMGATTNSTVLQQYYYGFEIFALNIFNEF